MNNGGIHMLHLEYCTASPSRFDVAYITYKITESLQATGQV